MKCENKVGHNVAYAEAQRSLHYFLTSQVEAALLSDQWKSGEEGYGSHRASS